MRVLKFGGTSLANPERFSQAAQLIEKAHLEEQAAGVLSAPAKITNHLVALSEKAALNQPTDTHFNEAIEIFYNIINGLHAENNKFDLAGTKALIDAEFAQIKGLLEEIRQAGKVEDKVKALHGNLMEVVSDKADIVVANIIADIIKILAKDVSKFLKDDGVFISSGIILAKIDEVCQALEENGFEIVKVERLGEWSAIVSKLK